MSEGPVFSDPAACPSTERLAEALGPRASLWVDLVREAEAMGARGEWSWDGPKYGWGWRMKRAGKPFLSLEPRSGAFRALVILGREQAEHAAGLPLGTGMRATYERARQFPDGRWLFHLVESERDVHDLILLLRLKLPPTIRARLEAAEASAPGLRAARR